VAAEEKLVEMVTYALCISEHCANESGLFSLIFKHLHHFDLKNVYKNHDVLEIGHISDLR
jgi:hypothetical protein